jgi:adenylate cyclase
MPAVRRLAAILAADVAGYSRLMGADEEGTHERLKAHRRKLADPKISEHSGRIVKTTGDGMLVEFPSVVDAVRCAAELQRVMIDREAGMPEDRRIRFRIGINLGDIIVDGDDIFGDGVVGSPGDTRESVETNLDSPEDTWTGLTSSTPRRTRAQR